MADFAHQVKDWKTQKPVAQHEAHKLPRLVSGQYESAVAQDTRGRETNQDVRQSEPTLRQPLVSGQYNSTLKNYDYDEFTQNEKNEIVELLKVQVSNKNNVISSRLSMALQKGSLKIQGGSKDDLVITQWPNEDQVRNILHNVQQIRTRTEPSPGRGHEERALQT